MRQMKQHCEQLQQLESFPVPEKKLVTDKRWLPLEIGGPALPQEEERRFVKSFLAKLPVLQDAGLGDVRMT